MVYVLTSCVCTIIITLSICSNALLNKSTTNIKEETGMKKAIIAMLLVVVMMMGIVPAMAEGDNVLRVYTDRVYRTWDQLIASDGNYFEVSGSFSEGLVRLDENHNPQPALAESYTVSDDGLVYTFILRDGLVWSNGTPLDAYDFEFSWLKEISDADVNGYAEVIAPFIKNGVAYMNGEIDASEVGIKAVDEKTFVVTLAAPASFFDRLITLSCCYPLNEEFYNSCGDMYATSADTILYCGPFVATYLDLSVGATLVKNPTYWDAENVKLDGLEFKVITDASAALNAYEANEIDRVNLSSTDILIYTGDPEMGSYTDFRSYFMQFDMESPNLNEKMRKALSYAIDRETLVNDVLMTGAVANTGIVSQGVYGSPEGTFRELSGDLVYYDPDLARQLWDEGVAELGFTPSLTMLTAEGADFDDMAIFVQDQFRTVLGIEVEIKSMTQKARNEIMKTEKYDFALNAWGADYDDAMTWLDLWCNDGGYRGNYAKEEYIALVDAARAEADPIARVNIMIEAEHMLVEEDRCIAGIYDRGYTYLMRDYVKGLIIHSIGQPMEYKWVSIEK